MLKTLLMVFIITVQGTVFVSAQASSNKADYVSGPKLAQPFPFKIGEKLTYEIDFSKFIFSGTIGQLNLSVSKADSEKAELIELRAEAISKGIFPKIFGIKVKDQFKSIINKLDFGLHSSIKLIEEGSLRREQKSIIDREAGRVTYVERDLGNKSAEPKIKEADHPKWIQDLLSAVYFIRTQRLNEGEVITVPISDGGEVYNIEVVVGKREKVKVHAGKFDTVKLDAKVFDGRYIRRSGEMHIWVSDDSKRVPVRAKIKASGATVTIDLRRIEKPEG